MAAITAGTLWAYGRRTVIDATGAAADEELFTAANDAVDMLAQTREWTRFKRRAYLSLLAPYSTGTITLTAGSATVTGSGTTFPTNAASGRLFVKGQIIDVATYSSGTSIALATTWGGATEAGLSYVLFYSNYALPENLFSFGQVLPGQAWGWGGDPTTIDDVWDAENRSLTGQQYPSLFAVADEELVMWPYPTEAKSVAYSYYARPTPISASTATSETIDWSPALLNVLHRAYDYQLALRFGQTVVGDAEKCWAAYQRALSICPAADRSVGDLGNAAFSGRAPSRVPLYKQIPAS